MQKAAGRRAIEGERAAARKARERAQAIAQARAPRPGMEAQQRAKEAAARAREAAAQARLEAAEQAEREKTAAAAAARPPGRARRRPPGRPPQGRLRGQGGRRQEGVLSDPVGGTGGSPRRGRKATPAKAAGAARPGAPRPSAPTPSRSSAERPAALGRRVGLDAARASSTTAADVVARGSAVPGGEGTVRAPCAERATTTRAGPPDAKADRRPPQPGASGWPRPDPTPARGACAPLGRSAPPRRPRRRGPAAPLGSTVVVPSPAPSAPASPSSRTATAESTDPHAPCSGPGWPTPPTVRPRRRSRPCRRRGPTTSPTAGRPHRPTATPRSRRSCGNARRACAAGGPSGPTEP